MSGWDRDTDAAPAHWHPGQAPPRTTRQLEPGVSGFHIDPTDEERSSSALVHFLGRCRDDPGVREAMSEGALRGAEHRYTWARYADGLLRLSRIHG